MQTTTKYIFSAISLLLIFNLSCVRQHSELSDEMSDQVAKAVIDSSMIDNPNLFNFEFRILNLSSQKSVDSINEALSHIQGLIGYETTLQNSTCLIYADSLDRYKNVMAAIEKAGYRIDPIFSMGGPGLTCNIQPENNNIRQKNIKIESLEKSVSSIKEEFNKNIDKVRIVSIPNPSCLSCVKGQRFINDLFLNEFPLEKNLIGFTVWISIDGWGKFEDVERLAPELQDERMHMYWDPEMRLGKLFKNPLGINKDYKTAWDVYLIYAPGTAWNEETPPVPTYWMHKIDVNESGVKEELFMNNEDFREKLKETLQKI